MRLEGKVALITGAATGGDGERMGLGGATAGLFAEAGARAVRSARGTGIGTGGAGTVCPG